MFEPIKQAFGEFMGRYYQGLTPTTRPMFEFVGRGFGKSVQYAPTRMIDAAEEMLAAWQRNDTDSAPTQPPKLPVIIVAMARDVIPTGRDFNRQIADPEYVMLEDDPKGRMFALRTVASDIRTQVAFFTQDEPTARSLAAQFGLFLDATGNRRFAAVFKNPLGEDEEWPVVIETPEIPFISVRTEAKNLCILAADLTLKVTVPLYSAPGADNPNNDQSGSPGTTDPSGYLGVADTPIAFIEAKP